MGEEEKIIEVTIDLGRPWVTLLLIMLVVAQAGYIGYVTLGTGEGPLGGGPDGGGHEPEELEGPEWYRELKADLAEAGCTRIIEEWDYWQGKHLDVGREEAFEQAGRSAFVGIYREMEAVYIFVNGTGYIWFIP